MCPVSLAECIFRVCYRSCLAGLGKWGGYGNTNRNAPSSLVRVDMDDARFDGEVILVHTGHNQRALILLFAEPLRVLFLQLRPRLPTAEHGRRGIR